MTRRKLPIGTQAFRETWKARRYIDDYLLEQARNLLGTSSVREAVHCALPEVVQDAARHREIEALVTMDGLDLADREIMKNAWRS
jgi:Arc/MetJ family transcription regulator